MMLVLLAIILAGDAEGLIGLEYPDTVEYYRLALVGIDHFALYILCSGVVSKLRCQVMTYDHAAVKSDGVGKRR